MNTNVFIVWGNVLHFGFREGNVRGEMPGEISGEYPGGNVLRPTNNPRELPRFVAGWIYALSWFT